MLLADDMQLSQFVLEEMLRNYGLETVFAKNGKEALQIASNQSFDYILLDMVMPVMDGLEACRQIRTLAHPNAGVPIVAITANLFDSMLAEYKEAGITATLIKPIDPDKLGYFLADLLKPDFDLNCIKKEKQEDRSANTAMDLTYLEKISKGNKSFVRSMVVSFYETIVTLKTKLADALLTQNSSAIQDLLHQLKFPLGVVGLTDLNQQITVLEEKSKQVHQAAGQTQFWEQIKELIPALDKLLQEAQLLLQETKG